MDGWTDGYIQSCVLTYSLTHILPHDSPTFRAPKLHNSEASSVPQLRQCI